MTVRETLRAFQQHVIKHACVWDDAANGSHHHPIWQQVADALASPDSDVVERLRSELAKFAQSANAYDGIPPAKYFGDTDAVLRYYDDKPIQFTLGECRRARALLSTLEADTARPETPDTRGVGEAAPLYVQFSNDFQHIRRWSREPFIGCVVFVEQGAQPPATSDDGERAWAPEHENLGHYVAAQLGMDLGSVDYWRMRGEVVRAIASALSPQSGER